MDQKHAMLYPDTSGITTDQRSSAAAAMGLPIEAPPSYDVATREPMPQPGFGWSDSVTDSAPITSNQHHSNIPNIVEQRSYPTQPVSATYPYEGQTYGIQTPQQPPHEANTITVQPSYTNHLGPNPSQVTCPACGASKVSRMSFTPNNRTHLCALLLCLVGWCCCACIVPYCMNSCRTGNHYCAKCKTFLGAYNPTPKRSIF